MGDDDSRIRLSVGKKGAIESIVTGRAVKYYPVTNLELNRISKLNDQNRKFRNDKLGA